jgi:hypothetical protein
VPGVAMEHEVMVSIHSNYYYDGAQASDLPARLPAGACATAVASAAATAASQLADYGYCIATYVSLRRAVLCCLCAGPCFTAATNPLARIAPAIPMQYSSGNWDYGWLYCRTDGHVAFRRLDPYTMLFDDRELYCPMRWFVR